MPWLSKFWMYFPIPLAGVAMVVFELEAIYNHIKSIFVKEGRNNECTEYGNRSVAQSFLVMILLRFPIAYAVALSSLLCLLSQGLPVRQRSVSRW